VRFAGLPVALVDGLSGRPGIATGLLGARADLEVKAAGASADAGTFRAKISSPTATIAVAARLENGSVVAIDEPALDLDAAVSQAWIDALLGPRLPAGARVALVDAKQHLRARVGGLRWPLAGGAAGADVLKNASLKAELSLPDLAYSDGKTPDTKTPAKAPATVRDLKITADVAPDRLPSAVVGAKVEGEPAGEIRATVRALDPPALLSEPDGAARFRVAAEVNAKSVPTGLVDALAGQDGLLVDVLGATIDLQVHSEGISQTAGPSRPTSSRRRRRSSSTAAA
jgi:hypothetical protein